jgi:pimeloyl-ACP methyl ester carboxylesterase
MPIAHVNEIDIYYEERGDGTPILCIHGTSSSALVWEGAMSELAEHGRCITYDRRGSFRSQRPEPYETTHVTEHTDDAAALLDALSATPAVVIGRSYGGEIALDLARRCPDKVGALALLEPAILSLNTEGKAWLQAILDRVLTIGATDLSSVAEVFLREVAGEGAWTAFPDEIKDMFRGNGPAILAELRGGSLELTAQEMRSIDQPALMVSAKDSPEAFRSVGQIVADALPNCDSVLIDGDHLISPSHPAVLRFVDGLDSRQSAR